MKIDDDEYIDCIKVREMIIKIAKDLHDIEKDQKIKSKVKAKKKPTINHWKARGAQSVAKYMLDKYPILMKVGMNPDLYKGLTTKIFKK